MSVNVLSVEEVGTDDPLVRKFKVEGGVTQVLTGQGRGRLPAVGQPHPKDPSLVCVRQVTHAGPSGLVVVFTYAPREVANAAQEG